MKKYNIIGDLHGKDPLKYFDKEYINVFVGDYFDPYYDMPFVEQQENVLRLFNLKQQNPDNIVILLGNHDFHYICPGEKYSRYSSKHAHQIKQIFDEFEDLIDGIAYNAGGYLVTHAGVSPMWLKTHGIDEYKSIDDLVESINNLWWDKERRFYSFSFEYNGHAFDTYGTSCYQSPIWIRAQTLIELKSKIEFPQIVGHSQFGDIVNYSQYKDIVQNINYTTFVDCLNYCDNTYKFEIE